MKAPADPDARELTPLDALLTPDQRTPLEIALEPGPLPWPQSLEENIRETSRRIDAQAMQPRPADCGNCRRVLNLDPEADAKLADPIRDHMPRTAPGHKVNRVLAILSEIENETTNRRFIH